MGLERVSPLDPLDHLTVDWPRVRRAHYLLEQQFTYEYPGPVTELQQRLMVLPSEWHGGQRIRGARLEVDAPTVHQRDEFDSFGNRVIWFRVPRVERRIRFTARIDLERVADEEDARLPAALGPRYLAETPLTRPDDALRAAAAALASEADETPLELVRQVNEWVYRQITYTKNVTSVETTAAGALAVRAGVCQDYAHVMLTLLRLLGLPARYISGHLLGEGATHAWVEVLLPDSARTSKVLVAHAFDPTHGCRAGLNYITIATGRDYQDVAPTSGSFIAPYSGTLSSSKRATITAIEYADATTRTRPTTTARLA